HAATTAPRSTLSLHDPLPISSRAGVRRAAHLPHRSFPRQGAGAEPDLLPLREPLPRADLEPPARRERTADDGGVFRRRGSRASLDRKSTRLNSSHVKISYAVF